MLFHSAGKCDKNDISKGLDISKESAEHTKIINGTLTLPFNEKIEIDTNQNVNKIISKIFFMEL